MTCILKVAGRIEMLRGNQMLFRMLTVNVMYLDADCKSEQWGFVCGLSMPGLYTFSLRAM